MANHDEYYDVSGRKRTEFSINNKLRKIFETKEAVVRHKMKKSEIKN